VTCARCALRRLRPGQGTDVHLAVIVVSGHSNETPIFEEDGMGVLVDEFDRDGEEVHAVEGRLRDRRIPLVLSEGAVHSTPWGRVKTSRKKG